MVKTDRTCRSSENGGKKGHLSDLERGVLVGGKQAAPGISETADLLGVSHTTISSVSRQWFEKEKTSSEQQVSG